jgi:hypothetical protein
MEHKKTWIILIVIVIVGWFLIESGILGSGKRESKYYIPPELVGSKEEGLTYFKETYPGDVSQAEGLCKDFFKAEWRNNEKELGCYNMEGFLEIYCGFNEAKDIEDVCKVIGGVYSCSSEQLGCLV